MAETWKEEEGSLLQEYHSMGQISELLPRSPVVYAWKLNPTNKSFIASDYEGVLREVMRLMSLPQGEVEATRINHSISLMGLRINGQKLDGNKVRDLKEWLSNIDNCKWMISYLESINKHLPTLYVGNTKNIRTRASEHLSELTGFGQRVARHKSLNWSDMKLHWIEIPNAQKPALEAIEFVTQSLTISAFTKRVG
jgi:hypothetical protein